MHITNHLSRHGIRLVCVFKNTVAGQLSSGVRHIIVKRNAVPNKKTLIFNQKKVESSLNGTLEQRSRKKVFHGICQIRHARAVVLCDR